jgi:hypothetical protein
MGVMNQKPPTAMNHAKTSFNTEIFAGAVVSVVQYLAPLRYAAQGAAACGPHPQRVHW